ncbi:MAG: hypothetical protein QM753_13520 [Thermomicrobiales bacterium]
MKRTIVARWAVLVAMLVGLLAPTLSMTAAAAPMANTAQAEASLAYVNALLAQSDDGDKKLPDEEETQTPEDEETPASRDDRGTSSDDALIGVLGGTRDDFEDEFGKAADDRDADDFATGVIYEDIRGFESIQVYWSEDDLALHIVLNASRDWTESRALSQAEDFLPADVELDEDAEELDGGELLFLGSSDALADVTDRSLYREYEVGGRPGDLRVILIPGDDNKFASVDIAIGDGDEFQSAGGRTTRETPEPTKESRTSRKTPTPTEETRTTRKTPTPTEKSGRSGGKEDADTYLADVRDTVDTRQKELDRFYEIISLGSSATNADFDELTTIVGGWLESPTLTAPAGYEKIDKAFTSMNNNFMSASLSFIVWIGDPDANASSLDEMSTYLKSAQSDLTTLDDLLKDEGF